MKKALQFRQHCQKSIDIPATLLKSNISAKQCCFSDNIAQKALQPSNVTSKQAARPPPRQCKSDNFSTPNFSAYLCASAKAKQNSVLDFTWLKAYNRFIGWGNNGETLDPKL